MSNKEKTMPDMHCNNGHEEFPGKTVTPNSCVEDSSSAATIISLSEQQDTSDYTEFGEFDLSDRSAKEESVLRFWRDNKIFEKSLKLDAPEGDFVFYEGPPTANGRPGPHHIESRTFKDIIPRYKTMRGYRVARKAGWDTHGLPVELEVEKQLGLQSKKEVENYGIAEFNKECKKSVWKYRNEWEAFTERLGYWVDMDDAYVTYHNSYIESLWNVVKAVDEKKFLYQDYKVLPWCPRCETALSSHELAQGYKDIKDLTVTAEFRVTKSNVLDLGGDLPVSILAWTTTPWTLPGNVALAVGADIDYVVVRKTLDSVVIEGENGESNPTEEVRNKRDYVCAKALVEKLFTGSFEIIKEFKGRELVGTEYTPLYGFIKDSEVVKSTQADRLENAFKVYTADFVTTEDGTGIVHISPMYGQDDFDIGTQNNLPKHHTVNASGKFLEGLGEISVSDEETIQLGGKFVKDDAVAVGIIRNLAYQGLLFKKAKYEHNYPHCWRCKTPVVYYGRDSWYIRMSELSDKMVENNADINWEPSHIRDGRFGEWLKGIKDWAISRERYWGTPLPVWQTEDRSEQVVIGSLDDLKKHVKTSGNTYYMMRHGQAQSNVDGVVSAFQENDDNLTELGKTQVGESAQNLKDKKIDVIISSPFPRTMQTAQIVANTLGIEKVDVDERLVEVKLYGFNNKTWVEVDEARKSVKDRYTQSVEEGEPMRDIQARTGELLKELEEKYKGKNILIVSHGSCLRAMGMICQNVDEKAFQQLKDTYTMPANAEVRLLDYLPLPRNEFHELDLHKPYIDDIELYTEDGKKLVRTPEVMDVWFDSGAMPYAQMGAMVENPDDLKNLPYPADYISEATDQTRGWFYTLHAIGALLDRGKAFKNCICLGLIMAADGTKMSKSKGNFSSPWEQIAKYGVDTLRMWMVAVNHPGDNKNYDEKSVVELQRKVFGLLSNIQSMYDMYALPGHGYSVDPLTSENILDQWVLARFGQLRNTVTDALDNYKMLEAARSIRDFIADFSQWYIRRSRDRIKSQDQYALSTTYFVLKQLAALMAPIAPFYSEEAWQKLRKDSCPISVHLASWPKEFTFNEAVVSEMKEVRDVISQALQLRAQNKMKVRQPLSSLTLRKELTDEYQEIVKDEVNVKSVKVNTGAEDISLDLEINPELQREGDMREVVRAVQAARKKQGLTPDQKISLSYVVEGEEVEKAFEEHKDLLQKTANITEFVPVDEKQELEVSTPSGIYSFTINL